MSSVSPAVLKAFMFWCQAYVLGCAVPAGRQQLLGKNLSRWEGVLGLQPSPLPTLSAPAAMGLPCVLNQSQLSHLSLSSDSDKESIVSSLPGLTPHPKYSQDTHFHVSLLFWCPGLTTTDVPVAPQAQLGTQPQPHSLH